MPLSILAARPTPDPRRVAARAIGLGLSALAAAALVAWTPSPAGGWNRAAAESTLWQLLNGARVNNGRAPLQSHGTLVSLARWRSQDMLDRDYFSHTIPGCGCQVYTYYDSNGVAWDWAGENIAWNSGRTDDYSPVRAHEQFMGSPGHRANVLDPRFTHGGVGAAAADDQMFQGHVQDTRMYTELFLDPKDAAPVPPPPSNPAPAPSPPSGGGASSGAAPAQTPAPTPEPKPKRVTVEALARPTSSAGLDGVAVRISRPAVTASLTPVLLAPERAAERAAQLEVIRPEPVQIASAGGETVVAASGVQVLAASDEPQPGLLEAIVSSIVGFLFG